MSKHIDTVITSCARRPILCCLRTLRAHGMSQSSLQLIFLTTVLAKLLYTAFVWWGFRKFWWLNRMEAFLWRAGKSGYYIGDFTIAALCEQNDEQLFREVTYNPVHSLHRLLPPERMKLQHTLPHGHTRSIVGYVIMSYLPKQQYWLVKFLPTR